AVDGHVPRAVVDPEVVVAADVPGGAGRSVAAPGRRVAIAAARQPRAELAIGDLLLEPRDLLVGRDERLARRALERRECGQVVDALQIRTAVRRARKISRLRVKGKEERRDEDTE